MQITTKYDMWQNVWAMKNGKPWTGTVWGINCWVKDKTLFNRKYAIVVSYEVSAGTFGGRGIFKESELFATKEELLKSF